MVKVGTSLRMETIMMEIGLIIKCMVLDIFIGMMDAVIQANGKRIKGMEMVLLYIKIIENMKASMKMIKNTDMEFLRGMMAEFMKDLGLKVSNMVWQSIQKKQEKSKLEFGTMETQSNG